VLELERGKNPYIIFTLNSHKGVLNKRACNVPSHLLQECTPPAKKATRQRRRRAAMTMTRTGEVTLWGSEREEEELDADTLEKTLEGCSISLYKLKLGILTNIKRGCL
jgi:hypothetical protein